MERAVSIFVWLMLGGCLAPRGSVPATLEPGSPTARTPEIALPLHVAAIVDLELLPASEPGQWRLASIDADGWLRVWSDGRMLGAWLAHPEGVVGLATAPDGTLYSAGFDGRV
ncbi:MAG TPA: hypothetical protein VK034_08150, partial [Enhygromyxa sp.]|nr:hypothetical protein [Enhygromyxa sp.]